MEIKDIIKKIKDLKADGLEKLYEEPFYHLVHIKSSDNKYTIIIPFFNYNGIPLMKKKYPSKLIKVVNRYKRLSSISVKIKPYSRKTFDNYESQEGLYITLENIEFIDYFARFISSVLVDYDFKLSDTHKVLISVAEKLEKWLRFFRLNSVPNPMSENQVIGLIGELNILSMIAQKIGYSDTLTAWQGNDTDFPSSQDFNFEDVYLEIKSTKTAGNKKIKIHGLKQLNPEESKPLFLVFNKLEEDKASGRSLLQIIEYINIQLKDNQNDSDLFMDKILMIGYKEDSKSNYYTRKFSFVNTDYYKVNDDFPKLPNKNFPEDIILDANYDMDLTSLDRFIINEEEVLEMI